MLFNSTKNELFAIDDNKSYRVTYTDGTPVNNAKLFLQHSMSSNCFAVGNKIYTTITLNTGEVITFQAMVIVDGIDPDEIVDISYAVLGDMYEKDNKRGLITILTCSGLLFGGVLNRDDKTPLVITDFRLLAEDVGGFDFPRGRTDGLVILNVITTKGKVDNIRLEYNLENRIVKSRSQTTITKVKPVKITSASMTAIIDDQDKLWLKYERSNEFVECDEIPKGTRVVTMTAYLDNLAVLLSDGTVLVIDFRPQRYYISKYQTIHKQATQHIRSDQDIIDISWSPKFLYLHTKDGKLLAYSFYIKGTYLPSHSIEHFNGQTPTVISNDVKNISQHTVNIFRESCTKRAR